VVIENEPKKTKIPSRNRPPAGFRGTDHLVCLSHPAKEKQP